MNNLQSSRQGQSCHLIEGFEFLNSIHKADCAKALWFWLTSELNSWQALSVTWTEGQAPPFLYDWHLLGLWATTTRLYRRRWTAFWHQTQQSGRSLEQDSHKQCKGLTAIITDRTFSEPPCPGSIFALPRVLKLAHLMPGIFQSRAAQWVTWWSICTSYDYSQAVQDEACCRIPREPRKLLILINQIIRSKKNQSMAVKYKLAMKHPL